MRILIFIGITLMSVNASFQSKFRNMLFYEIKPPTQLSHIGSGVCQALAGYDIYNLKTLDENGRHPYSYTPAVIDTKKGAFFYKIC